MNRPVRFAFLLNTWDDNLGPMYISSYLKRGGHVSELFVEQRGWLDRIDEFRPDVVAFSAITGHQRWVGATLRKLEAQRDPSRPKPLALVGGPHPTYFPEMAMDPTVDVICRGDGEESALELADAIAADKDWSEIPNLAFMRDGELVVNPLRSLGRDNDRFAHPDREWYDRYPLMRDNPYRNVITGRGCPYKCNFCFNPSLMDMYKGKDPYIRRRSVEDVLAELTEIDQRWGLKGVRFVDDLFTLNRKWLAEFLPAYQKRIGVPFTCNVRADALDRDTAKLLKEAGCRMVLFGVESGSQRIRNEILKKTLTDDSIRSTAALIKEHGMEITTYNMIGSPGETTEEALLTVKMNREIKADYPWCSLVQFYPRTDIHKVAVDKGVIDEGFDYDQIGYTYFKDASISQPNRDELIMIHRFFLLLVKFPFLEPILLPIIKKMKPNRLFEWVFLASYAVITLGRSRMGLGRLARVGWKSLWLFAGSGDRLHGKPNRAPTKEKVVGANC